ncbi:ABC transporter permease [Sutterella megalosphaeroides]|uniref:Peptide ABC transporter permease n=1 Tax=Sutterella megalosphaeroides TaxID=2494234 RepID=A0A2Z6ICN2_9BURK|nr:ABC transporter permease [Sutterella megalosphaeroides]BBF23680.1 peptide ABC transporter permease [Sutterella megalosphaeroides]
MRFDNILGRFLALVPVLLAITFVTFGLLRLAGGDVVTQKMENTGQVLSPEVVAEARRELGLDRPFLVQYARWLAGILQGDMGKSYVSGLDVFDTFVSKLPATLLLAGAAVGLTAAISIPLGTLAAMRRGGAVDRAVRFLSFAGNSAPNFFVALLLMYVFAIRLELLPVLSREPSLRGAILPALTLATAMSAKYVRQVRAAVLDELQKPYVEGARARGVPEWRTIVFGVLRASGVTIVTLLALSIGSLLGGAAIVETIFMWDGVGRLAVDAIRMRDYPIIMAYVMWMSIIYVTVNFLADLTYRKLDPRIRAEGA